MSKEKEEGKKLFHSRANAENILKLSKLIDKIPEYIESKIVDGDYTMTEQDEKDFRLHGRGKNESYDIAVYHSKQTVVPETIVDIDDGHTGCVHVKFKDFHTVKDIISWHKSRL